MNENTIEQDFFICNDLEGCEALFEKAGQAEAVGIALLWDKMCIRDSKVYEEVLIPEGMGDVAIYTELGRFMMGPYGCLVTKAIHEKHTHKEYIGVDSCAVNLMRPAMYLSLIHIFIVDFPIPPFP